MSLVILPHQLYDKKYIDKNYKIVLYEHPHYFKKYNYNKKRLMLHFASMEYYKDYLKENGYKVRLIKYDKKFTLKSYDIFDPIDKIKLEEERDELGSLTGEVISRARMKFNRTSLRLPEPVILFKQQEGTDGQWFGYEGLKDGSFEHPNDVHVLETEESA